MKYKFNKCIRCGKGNLDEDLNAICDDCFTLEDAEDMIRDYTSDLYDD